ncbi:MAG: ABC1 kinase family protein [Cyanobacteriota bacterium]|jgi:ubiquinone biosynthesis protein
MLSLAQASARQREIIEIVFSNGWDYMRALLLGAQTGEPQIPTPAVLCKILTELGPFYVKLGQLLSTRPDLLPPSYIEALSALQSQVPAVAWPPLEAQLKETLGRPLEDIFQEIDPRPIAAGSIGQVHRAVLKTGEAVALKIQRPGIDAVVEQDVGLIRGAAELAGLSEFGKTYDVVQLADEFIRAVRAELNFKTEARYTDTLRRNLDQSDWLPPNQLVIPQVYWELTTEKLLVLEWLRGGPLLEADLTQPPGLSPEDRRQTLTSLLLRAFCQQFYRDGFFHADPHPGNLFYLEDGRLALIDCGMVGRLDPRTQQILTEMLLAIFELDSQRCAQLTLELSVGINQTNLEQLEVDYEKMLRKYYDLSLAEVNFSEIIYELLQIARSNRVKVPGSLGLYAKCLANLEGTGRQFNPELNLLSELQPLMADLLTRQLLGANPLQTGLRAVLDLKSMALKTPRQVDVFLDRLNSETLQWTVRLPDLDPVRRSIDRSANRLSFSVVVGALIMGAAIISTGSNSQQLALVANILFSAASLLGLWLIVSILRSGRLK